MALSIKQKRNISTISVFSKTSLAIFPDIFPETPISNFQCFQNKQVMRLSFVSELPGFRGVLPAILTTFQVVEFVCFVAEFTNCKVSLIRRFYILYILC